MSVGEGDVWFDGDSTWLFHYKKPHNHPAILLNFFKFCPPVVFIWFWLFFSCLRQRFFECGGGREGRDDKKLPIIFSKHSFPIFYYHKINLHLGICRSIFEKLIFFLFPDKGIFLKLWAIIF